MHLPEATSGPAQFEGAVVAPLSVRLLGCGQLDHRLVPGHLWGLPAAQWWLKCPHQNRLSWPSEGRIMHRKTLS